MATSSVILDTTQYVRVNVGYTTMILQAHNDSVRVVLSDAQPSLSNEAFHTLGGGDAPLTLDIVDVNVWVLAVSDKSSLIVTETDTSVITEIKNVIDANNSTTTPLAADAIFTGAGVDVSRFSNITIQLFADQSSATDGMKFQFSCDNVNWDDSHDFTLTANQARRFQFAANAQYFRVVLINGSTIQTAIRIQTILHTGGILTTIHRISDSISGDNSAQLMKTVLSGENPGGTFVNFGATNGGNFKVSLEEWNGGFNVAPLPVTEKSKTAFGEVLMGQLSPQFQGSFEYTVSNTDLNTNTVANGGTVTQASGMAVVGSSTTTASTALFQSKQHAKYRPGLGGNSRFTALFTSPVVATEQYIGIMDETGSSAAFKNGYAIGYDGTTFGFHRFQNDSKITVAQANWDDPLDGTGNSGMTIDQTKINVFEIRYQYLGAGKIQLCVEDDSTGDFVVVHTVLYANNFTEPSTHNPNFHHTMWVDNKATTSNMILKSASYAYFVEGKTSFIELHQPENASGTKEKTTVTTEVAIFTIRNKSTYASKTNFIDVVLLGVGASIEASSANNLGTVRVVKNATLGGTPSWSDINTTDSVMEIDTAGTTVTGGKELGAVELAGKNDRDRVPLLDSKIILNPGESVTVAGDSANSATMRSQGSWRELF